jgi:hypothetical protein
LCRGGYLDVLRVLEDDLVLEGDLAREEVHDAQLIELALDLLRLVLGKAQQNLLTGHRLLSSRKEGRAQ